MKKAIAALGIFGFVLVAGYILLTQSPLPLFGTTNSLQWIQRYPVHSPCARQGAALVYDNHNAVIILFGGHDYGTGVWFDDTWVWNGEDWTKLNPAVHPPGTGGGYNVHSMVYDIARQETLLFTGVETWTLHYDGQSSVWERKYPATSPWSRWGHSMAYDSLNNTTILFGGYGGGRFDDQTWAWDGTNWSHVAVEGPIPEPRNMQKLCYMGDGKTLLYGGHNYYSYLNNTWVYDSTLQKWTCVCSSPAFSCASCMIPEDRSYHFMAFNPDVRLAFVFGGYNYYYSPQHYDDTWTWDGSNWTKLPISFDPYARPSRRSNHANAMVYDEARHEMVLFGGQLEGPETWSSDETWVLKGIYVFEGFFSPIENLPIVNKAKAGQTVPIKWRVTDADGTPISDPASFISLRSYTIDCSTFEGDPVSAVEEYAAGSSGLQYLGDGYWQFNWKTPKTYAGQCRTLTLTLGDHSQHLASMSFN